MRAALACNFLANRRYLLRYGAVLLIVDLLLCFTAGDPTAGSAYLMLTPLMISFTMAQYDSIPGWTSFELALPYSRTTFVAARYLTLLIIAVVCYGLALAVGYVMIFVGPYIQTDMFDFSSIVENGATLLWVLPILTLALGCVMLVLTAIFQPFILRFGFSKAMMFASLAVVILVLLGSVFLGDAFASAQNLDLDGYLMLFLSDPVFRFLLILVGLGITMAFYWISCAISARLIRNKEM